jgi:hypothetical protein
MLWTICANRVDEIGAAQHFGISPHEGREYKKTGR